MTDTFINGVVKFKNANINNINKFQHSISFVASLISQ